VHNLIFAFLFKVYFFLIVFEIAWLWVVVLNKSFSMLLVAAWRLDMAFNLLSEQSKQYCMCF